MVRRQGRVHPLEQRDDDTAFPKDWDSAPRKDKVVEVEDCFQAPREVHIEQRVGQSVKSMPNRDNEKVPDEARSG